ncbi:MAG: hypothetical protein ABEL76_15760, partial [Bradymonadaceae bacterium]
QILTQYFTFGALAGLNQLKDVLTKPTYGAYVETKNDDGESIYQLVDRTKTCEQGREFTSNGQTFRVTCVDPGPGRTKNTRYDRGSGYYYYQRPTEIGHFWDYLVAMSALSASQTRVIGENTTERFFSFTIPYTLVFRDSL